MMSWLDSRCGFGVHGLDLFQNKMRLYIHFTYLSTFIKNLGMQMAELVVLLHAA